MADQVSNGKVVSFSYTLRDSEGNVLEQTEKNQPMQYLHGNQNIIPGLEKEMEGMNVGDSKKVTVEPQEGYGEYDEKLVFNVPRTNFPKEAQLEPGMEFQAQTEQGPMPLIVLEVADDHVIVDANHPMAGETLNFEVTVEEVRTATTQELSHGHVHSGGHDH